MFTITRPVVASMYPELCSSTWSQEPWTVSDPDLLDRSLDQIILCSDRAEQGTTGPRVITQKVNKLYPYIIHAAVKGGGLKKGLQGDG